MRTVALLSLSQLVAGQVGEQLDGCCTMGESCWPDAHDLAKLSRKFARMSFSHLLFFPFPYTTLHCTAHFFCTAFC